MAYVAPSTVTTLQTYTSAAHNIIVNDIIDHEARLNSYAGVYTNEAARDAAITSPTEGMSVYLTAPTVPAATGDATFVPTGITTIYNGTSWVCVTPVSARTTAQGLRAASAYTATLTGTPGTNPSVTLTTGTTALVSLYMEGETGAGAGSNIMMSFAVSGATTLAASDAYRIINSAIQITFAFGNTFVVSGLTAGSNTFTLQYASSVGGGAFRNRSIIVQGIA